MIKVSKKIKTKTLQKSVNLFKVNNKNTKVKGLTLKGEDVIGYQRFEGGLLKMAGGNFCSGGFRRLSSL